MAPSDKEQAKKKITEVKTFSVPFALDEIKKNITIATNSPSKPSKEEIINQALKFHSEGNIPKALECYQHFIKQGFKDERIFSNYGLILRNLGKLQEAEIATRKAIEVKPDYANAHCNLGIILIDLGKLEEAEIATRKAIELNPNLAVAHSNLGGVLIDLGNFKEAEFSTRKAIELNPNLATCYQNLSLLLYAKDNINLALKNIKKACSLDPISLNNQLLLTIFRDKKRKTDL